MKTAHNNLYSAYSIIKKKRDGQRLTHCEIQWFIAGLLHKKIDETQMAALLMALFIQGCDKEETAALTHALLNSGTILEFDDPTIIDKHSTGGVGDKTSFILAPIAAACGVKVPMIAGRGLGHTGGTIDKIESIPNFKTNLNLSQFTQQLKAFHLCLIGQTNEIAPADGILYSLRDITATVESIPLITASIMSKKLASGAAGLVMDIKVGGGAFMKNLTEGKKLAQSLHTTAARFDKKIISFLTDMSQPLGHAVGNSLEIIESIATLQGQGPKDLTTLSVSLAGAMIYLAGLSKTHTAGISKAQKALKNGSAFKKFAELVSLQGGDSQYLDDTSKFQMTAEQTSILSPHKGYIHGLDAEKIGLCCVQLGGGRLKKNDHIDHAVGLTIHKKCGQYIKKGQTLVTIHHHHHQKSLVASLSERFLTEIIKIKSQRPTAIRPIILTTKGL